MCDRRGGAPRAADRFMQRFASGIRETPLRRVQLGAGQLWRPVARIESRVSVEGRIRRAVRLRPIRQALWPNATRQREDPEAPRLISPAQVAPVRPEGAAESVLVEQREPIWQPDQWRPRLPALLAVWGRRCRRLRIGFAGSAGREAAARWGALLFAIAGVLGLVALAFPGGAGTSSVAAAATSFLACAVGGWLWLAGAVVRGCREPARFSVYRWVRCCRGCGLRSGCAGRPSRSSSCNRSSMRFWRAESRARSA
jgi:hypothetical protein